MIRIIQVHKLPGGNLRVEMIYQGRVTRFEVRFEDLDIGVRLFNTDLPGKMEMELFVCPEARQLSEIITACDRGETIEVPVDLHGDAL